MKNSTSIEVRCECRIPFHHELVNYIHEIASDVVDENYNLDEIPHKEAIIAAIRTKIVFIRFKFKHSLKKIKPRLLKAIKKTFQKKLIGTIKEGKDEITLILL